MPRSKSRTKRTPTKKAAAKKKSGGDLTLWKPFVNADQALYFNIATKALYGLTFLGVQGDACTKFYGEECGTALCQELPKWMGLINLTFAASAFNTLRNGSASDKKRHLFTMSIQWMGWFVWMITTGAKGAGGLLVDNEYYMGLACIFLGMMISRMGGDGASLDPVSQVLNTTQNKVTAFLNFMVLFNTFNVGVMGGRGYWEAAGETPSASCQAMCGFLGVSIFLTIMDGNYWMNCTGTVRKNSYVIQIAVSLVGMYLTFSGPSLAATGTDMAIVNFVVNGLQIAMSAHAYNGM